MAFEGEAVRGVLTRAYRRGAIANAGVPVEDVSEQLAEADTIVWVDSCDPTKQQLDQLADELGLHELAVEDALSPHQRPKLDPYSRHLFLACHGTPTSRMSTTTSFE